MRRLIRGLTGLLTLRQWWGALGLTLLLVLLWSLSVHFGWPATVPLTGTVALLVAGIVGLLVDRFRAARRAAALEQSLHGQAQDQIFGVRPERREEIAQVEREFASAVTALKQSKVGKGRSGRSALYALPWYVVIGPPAAGKTSAITGSGLDFPMGAQRVRGIGGTRNCDWFFSTAAILLDTAGRYMTVEEDLDEWNAFLGLLRQHRPRTPVNGVLVMVSMEELLRASPEELQELALDLRHRIDELVTGLGVRFPLYLVFTKCDLLRGFTDFFAELDADQRAQVWGCTLPLRGASDEGARARFEHEFDRLTEQLHAWRVDRLAAVADGADGPGADAARDVYVFPLEFAAVRDVLASFVEQLLHSNPYEDTPHFRGFYFTSALQGGSGDAFDHVLPAIADRFEIAGWDGGAHLPPEQSRSYFLGTLFRDVIVRDRTLVTPSSSAERRRVRTRRAAIAAAALLLVAFGGVAGAAYSGSSSDLDAAYHAAATSSRPRDVASLDSLDRAIARLERRATMGRQIRRLGLDRSGAVLETLRALYARRAAPLLVQPLVAPLEARLRGHVQATPEVRASGYNDLRAYLLLGPEVRRVRESAGEARFLRGYLHRQLGGRPGDSVYTDRYVAVLGAPAVRVDSQLVQRTRDLLYTPPTLDGLYQSLRDEGARQLAAVPLARIVGQGAAAPFEPSASIPGLYTKGAWEAFVQDAIERRSREPGRTDWVVGSRPDRLPPELADPDSVASALLQRYFADYIVAWKGLLTGVRYTRGSPDATARMFIALGDPAKSPLVALLDSVSAETRFENATVAGTREKLSDFTAATLRKFGYVRAESGIGAPRNPVDRAFASLHALRDRNHAASLEQLLTAYASFGQTLQAYAPNLGSPGTGAQLAADVARTRGVVARSTQDVDPEIRAALFEQPLDTAAKTIGGVVVEGTNAKWAEQVCRPFGATLEGRYPFAERGPDAAPADVERFLQPQAGTLWAFFERELAATVSPSDFQPLPGHAGALSISPRASGMLRRAKRLRDGLFAGAGGMRVEFTLTPHPLDPSPDRKIVPTDVCLAIDGQRQCYSNGNPFPQSFVWPARGGAMPNSITVTVSERGKPTQLRVEAPGDWGWLRLLDSARVTPAGGSESRVVWRLPHPSGHVVQAVYTLAVKGAVNPFANRDSLFGELECPPLVR